MQNSGKKKEGRDERFTPGKIDVMGFDLPAPPMPLPPSGSTSGSGKVVGERKGHYRGWRRLRGDEQQRGDLFFFQNVEI